MSVGNGEIEKVSGRTDGRRSEEEEEEEALERRTLSGWLQCVAVRRLRTTYEGGRVRSVREKRRTRREASKDRESKERRRRRSAVCFAAWTGDG